MTTTSVFYSWQSDLPNATNRGLIQTALEQVVKAIREDQSVAIEPVVDRDTVGVGGSPDIALTIFKKIELAALFVADVSIIGHAGDRPTPNPNVLVELGYAKKALGPDRVLMIMNTAFGVPEDLPFDLRFRRVVAYYMPRTDSDRATERRQLQNRLETELRAMLAKLPPSTSAPEMSSRDRAIEAITTGARDTAPRVRGFTEQLVKSLSGARPNLSTPSVAEAYARVVETLPGTVPLVIDFARVSTSMAEHDSLSGGLALFQGLSGILDDYQVRPGSGRSFYEHEFVFDKFLGHEMMVILFAPLVREERWDIVATILDRDITLSNANGFEAGEVPFTYASRTDPLWSNANSALLKGRMSLQFDLLNERHTNGMLAEIVSVQDFAEADYFLFLRSVLQPPDPPSFPPWCAWSCLTLHQAPRYLRSAVRLRAAERLLAPLGVPDIATLRSRLQHRARLFSRIFPDSISHPLERFSFGEIGTRP